MAINLITAPTGGAPLSTNDYDAQNEYIQALILVNSGNQLLLTEWGTLTIPELAQYVYIMNGGALFQVQDSNETITDPGGLADGRLYIKVERSGDTLTAELVDDATGYSWNYVYNGFYHADGSQLLPYVLYRDTADYWKYTLEGSRNKFDIEAYIEKNISLNIGVWNMDASNTATVTFTSYVHRDLIMGISDVTIIPDTGEAVDYFSITFCTGPGENPPTNMDTNGIWSIGATSITLYRTIGGDFDAATYNNASINRGYILLRIRV